MKQISLRLPLPNFKFYIQNGRPSLKPVLEFAEHIQDNIPILDDIREKGNF